MATKSNPFNDWLMLNKSSPLKLLGQIKANLAGVGQTERNEETL
jgi:hypothetical protein